MEVWNIIERGFAPIYANDLTRREQVDCQLNATALNIIQNALSQKEMADIRSCKTAKGSFEKLTGLFIAHFFILGLLNDGISNEQTGQLLPSSFGGLAGTDVRQLLLRHGILNDV